MKLIPQYKMGYIKVKGVTYLEEKLTDKERIKLGLKVDKKEILKEEKELLKELKETPLTVKKNRVAN